MKKTTIKTLLKKTLAVGTLAMSMLVLANSNGSNEADSMLLTTVQAEEVKLSFKQNDFVFTQAFLTDEEIAANEIEATGYTGEVSGKVKIPSKVTFKGQTYTVTSVGLFTKCKKLKEITIPDTVTNIHALTFEDCTSLKKVTLPKNLKELNVSTFSGCKKLTTVKNLEQVQIIGSSAFSNCTSLKKVTLGKNLKKIGLAAFSNCKNLKTVNIQSTKLKEINVGTSAFHKIHKNAVINVPAGKVNAYKKILSSASLPKKAKMK